jgi:hypothetical protein
MKFSGVLGVVHQMAHAGFIGGKLVIVATFEVLSAELFLYPMTPSFGFVFLSAFLGGAVCTHVQMGELPGVVPAGMLPRLAWLGTYLRHPEVL